MRCRTGGSRHRAFDDDKYFAPRGGRNPSLWSDPDPDADATGLWILVLAQRRLGQPNRDLKGVVTASKCGGHTQG